MNVRCKFDKAALTFVGSPVEQARCLLRFVKRAGNVDDVPADLPAVLETFLAAPATMDITRAQVRQYLKRHDIPESHVGGSLDKPVSRANSNHEEAPLARYFLIHDTSTKLKAGETFDPNFINTARWSGNKLSHLERGKTHIYITRLGETLTDTVYQIAWRATRFELRDTIYRGLCLHHELVQPRMGRGSSDVESPNPGFTQAQYERLALQYIIASVRRESWMIPAFHCVLDLGIGDHDDPQHFDLAMWGMALESTLSAVRSIGLQPETIAALLARPSIHLDFEARPEVERAFATGGGFRTLAAESETRDGSGGSSTTGLDGMISETAGETITNATETLTAFRDRHSLGTARRVKQVRRSRGGVTTVEQPDYCWGRRTLPNAELVDSHPGFGSDPSVFKGKATFFGKSDLEDEGTGTPAFGTVQTNSSVFGVSLKRAHLLAEYLMTEGPGNVLHPTEKGLNAIVEVFFPQTGRLARLPLVDIGPGTTGAARTAIADITVAATAFLQKLTEDQIDDLDNIHVHARIVTPSPVVSLAAPLSLHEEFAERHP
jgi:hypothetical protein